MPAYRRPVFGKLIAGLVLIAIGASNIYGLGEWWPLIIIGVGVVILFNALFRIRK
jgi:type IV secretory pathway VirB2 component (pilin)